jgi:hypothetical protein
MPLLPRVFRVLAKALYGIGFLALACQAPVQAAETDEQIWLAQFSTFSVGNKWLVFTEAQVRQTDGLERLSQIILRPAVGYQVSDAVSVFAGYAWVHTEPKGRAANTEHRAYQQLSVRLTGGSGKVTVASRTRLEQRFIVGRSDMGWRMRNLVRLDVPLGKGYSAIVSGEPFVNLDTTTWGQRAGFDQMRGFAGVGIPVARGVALEVGYAGQYVNRFGVPDRMNHIGSLSFNIRR